MRGATYGGAGLEGNGAVPLVNPLVGGVRYARPELDLRVIGVGRGGKAQAAVPRHNLTIAVHDVEGLAFFGVALAEANGLAIATGNGTALLETCASSDRGAFGIFVRYRIFVQHEKVHITNDICRRIRVTHIDNINRFGGRTEWSKRKNIDTSWL